MKQKTPTFVEVFGFIYPLNVKPIFSEKVQRSTLRLNLQKNVS
jgi:hypothetical protein